MRILLLGIGIISFIVAGVIFIGSTNSSGHAWISTGSLSVAASSKVPAAARATSSVQVQMPVPTTLESTTTTTSTETTTYRELFNGIIYADRRHTPLYAASDAVWFAEWSKRLQFERQGMPRVLIFTWCTESGYYRYINEVHKKTCYAHAHGFDIVFTAEKNFTGARGWNWPMFAHLGYKGEEMNNWAWMAAIIHYLDSGEYDYVFYMTFDTLIHTAHFDFPVWAWDRGQDITMMDQYHFVFPDAFGLNFNNILFKATDYTKQFLREVFDYRNGFYLGNEQAPLMETILRYLGKERVTKGKPNYDGQCTQWVALREPYEKCLNQDFRRFSKLLELFSQCFFKELDHMIGVYGFRNSDHFGFSPTFNMQPNGNRLLPEYYSKPSILGPWANCWRNIRKWWPHYEQNCFAIRWNEPHMVVIPSERPVFDFVNGACPDPKFDWWWSPFNNRLRGAYLQRDPNPPIVVHNRMFMYFASDWLRFREWAPRIGFDYQKLPRVLIYTWCAEDTYSKYVNEVYWKSCYAHAHGFDLVFSPLNISLLNGFDQWEAKEHMWSYWPDLQKFLFSGDYDYVLIMSVNSLIHEINLDYPVWAWDTNHDITVMDEHVFERPYVSGLDMNNILIKASDFTFQFGNDLFEKRKHHQLFEGDNGVFMEMILQTLGNEDKAVGNAGYDKKCEKLLKETSRRWSDGMKYAHLNEKYNRCFFNELDHLVGPFTARLSNKIGFSQTVLRHGDSMVLPYNVHGIPGVLGPWANCWSSPRKSWSDPDMHCFASRYSESEVAKEVTGQCPDPTFNWEASPYNPANRGFR